MNPLKRTLVHAGLVLFALWPLAHLVMVRHYHANPWKLAGWGMYAAPQIPPGLQVSALNAAGDAEPRALPVELEPVAGRFQRRRLGLGRLARPEALGRALLETCPDEPGVRIDVVQPVLDARSGRVREEVSSYEYRRAEPR